MTAVALLAVVTLAGAAMLAGSREQALRVLYRAHGATVMAVAMRMLHDRGEAEDVVQETFLELWRRADSYDARRASPATWAVVIARSRSIDRLRSRSAARRALDAQRDDPVDAGVAVEPVEARENRERVREALAELPPEQRIAVELAFFEGLTHSEIAARLKQPLGTVKTRVRLAMEKLQSRLAPEASP